MGLPQNSWQAKQKQAYIKTIWLFEVDFRTWSCAGQTPLEAEIIQ